jgi:hypothetical protein
MCARPEIVSSAPSFRTDYTQAQIVSPHPFAAATGVEDGFLIGDDVLVAPVVKDGEIRTRGSPPDRRATEQLSPGKLDRLSCIPGGSRRCVPSANPTNCFGVNKKGGSRAALTMTRDCCPIPIMSRSARRNC